MDLRMRYVNGDSDTDSGMEYEPLSGSPYPHGNGIMKIWLSDEQKALNAMAMKLDSTPVPRENFKIDGFIAELLVSDMFSLGSDILGLDLSLKWSAVTRQVIHVENLLLIQN